MNNKLDYILATLAFVALIFTSVSFYDLGYYKGQSDALQDNWKYEVKTDTTVTTQFIKKQ